MAPILGCDQDQIAECILYMVPDTEVKQKSVGVSFMSYEITWENYRFLK